MKNFKFIGPILFVALLYCSSCFSQNNQWKVYNTSNSDIPDNYILSIGIDENDNKWMGTRWGIVKYDGENWIKYSKNSTKEIEYTSIRNITIDSAGQVWTGTWGDGMAFLRFPLGKQDDPNAKFKWIYYKEKNSAMPHNVVKAICIDKKGNKWIGTEEGLLLMEVLDWGEGGLRWKTFYTSNSGLPHDAVYNVAVDKFNNKWIGTFGGGLAKFDGINWTIYDIKNSGLPDNYIISMVIDHEQVLWIGTYSGGLARFDGTDWKVFKTANSELPDNVVYSLAVDNENKLWIGSINSGMASFDGSNWKTYDIMNSGKPYTVSALSFDRKGNLWIGTGGGVAVYNEDGIK